MSIPGISSIYGSPLSPFAGKTREMELCEPRTPLPLKAGGIRSLKCLCRQSGFAVSRDLTKSPTTLVSQESKHVPRLIAGSWSGLP